PHLARHVHLRPGDVRVHVHAPGHDDEPSRVQDPVGPLVGARRRPDHLAVPDPEVADLAVDAVGGVVDRAVCDLQERHRLPAPSSTWSSVSVPPPRRPPPSGGGSRTNPLRKLPKQQPTTPPVSTASSWSAGLRGTWRAATMIPAARPTVTLSAVLRTSARKTP